MQTKLTLLALLVGASVCSSAFAAAPGKASVKDGWQLKNLSMVKHNPSGVGYAQRVTRSADGLKLNISWDVWNNDTANKSSVLLNGSKVWTGTGNIKTAPITIAKGGDYALTVELCNDDGCSVSDPLAMQVLDTDGSGSPVLDAPLQDHNKPYKNSTGKVVGTYYTEWSQYGRHFPVEKIPAQNLTHILYGFIPICGPNESLNIEGMSGSLQTLKQSCQGQPDYTVTLHDMGAALGHNEQIGGNFGKIIAMKKANPNLKILPSIGGWTLSDPFFDMHDVTKRATFIKSVKVFLQTWKFFDGVDIDWEFPGGGGANPALGNPRDKETYTKLMQELRAMLDELSKTEHRTYQLTSAIGAGEAKIAAVDYGAAKKYMDYIFVMNYDFAGHFDLQNLNHQTSLYTQNDIGTTTVHSTEKAIDALLKQGVEAKKLVVGVAEYGRAWAGVEPREAGKPFTGTATGPMIGNALGADAKGVLLSHEIESHYSSGDYKTFYDNKAQAAWIYNEKTKELISYDSPRSVKAKGDYVTRKGLGGLFSWEIGNSNGNLLNAMHEGLGHGEGTTDPENQPPVAIVPGDQRVSMGAAVTLDGSSSYDPEGEKLTYDWTQLAGTTVKMDNPSAAVAHFTAPDVAGDLVFSLIVSDGEHLSKATVVKVSVEAGEAENNAPVINIAGPKAINVKGLETVHFDASKTTDKDGDSLTFKWNMLSAEGEAPILAGRDSAVLSVTAPKVDKKRTYTFQLTVSDGKANVNSEVYTVNVLPDDTGDINHAPEAHAGKNQQVQSESEVVLDGSKSTDKDNDKLTYVWTQKSGAHNVILNDNDKTFARFTAPKVDQDTTLVFTLTVSDGKLSSSADVNVTVKAGEITDGSFTAGTVYVIGDKVTWKGKAYRCLQAHTGALHWAPDVAHSLWVAE
ncbi:glycoside hydrolase [Enterobacteriaceae bacterium RIT693]|jgi:chitinase|nr:glycoside hydrolase [Enterobacteriaceae bacterium RIT693]